MISAIRSELRQLDQSRRALRPFGVTIGTAFTLIAALLVWRNGWTPTPASYALAGVGGVVIFLGLVAPGLLRHPHRLWMGLALVLGFVMTRVILTVVFYLAVTPIGLILRMMGKDPLQRRIDRETPSYWQEKTYDDPSPKRFEKYY